MGDQLVQCLCIDGTQIMLNQLIDSSVHRNSVIFYWDHSLCSYWIRQAFTFFMYVLILHRRSHYYI